MTTPASFGTVRAAIDQAYVNAGLIAENGQANSEQYANGINRLNQLVNYWQTKGLKLWTNVDTPVPLTALANVYTLGPGAAVGISMVKPLRVAFGYFQDTSGNKTPMDQISRQEISILQNGVYSPGQPVSFFVDKQQLNLVVTVWPAPSATAATGQVHLVLQNQITGAVSLTDQMAFPIEWFVGITWGLADELCTGQPDAIVARCAMRAKQFREDLEGWDVEDAQTFFVPASQMMVQGDSFV